MPNVNAGTFNGLIRSLDSDALRRGKQFEKIVKWWLTQDPLLSRDIKKVWLWDEWPGRTGPDTGIDLVALMLDGSLTAIQAKCFDQARDIPKSELDSFISAASPRKFAHRLLVASTDGLSSNARRALQDNNVIKVMRSDLEASLDIWPATFSSLGGSTTISKWGPRPQSNEGDKRRCSGPKKSLSRATNYGLRHRQNFDVALDHGTTQFDVNTRPSSISKPLVSDFIGMGTALKHDMVVPVCLLR